MLAPLTKLTGLLVGLAPQLTAWAVVPLQSMLPQLKIVTLCSCGKLIAGGDGDAYVGMRGWEVQEVLLAEVKQLVRPGLQLHVSGY